MSDTDSRVQFKLMIPADLKATVEESAAVNRRSLSSEVVDRLYRSYDIPSAASSAGSSVPNMIELDNVLNRLQSVTDSSFQLFAEMRDEARRQGGGVSQVENFRLEPGIHKVMADHKMERAEAIRFILKDWMVREGMLPVD